jgi:hypothetical protein
VLLNDNSDTFLVTIENNSPSELTITKVFVDGCLAKIEHTVVISSNSCEILFVTIIDGISLLRTYQIKVQSLEGCPAIYYKILVIFLF